MRKLLLHGLSKPLACLLVMLPFAWLMYGAYADRLGPNPAEHLIRSTGDWALRFLCLVLAITPARILTRTPALARFRRMMGLTVYCYAVLHLLAYSWLDMGLDVGDITLDVLKRPFILVGFVSFLLLTPLALTSFNRAIKYMGAAHWKRLHQLAYVVPWFAILHFFWMRAGKNSFSEVGIYALILCALLGWRIWNRWRA